MSGKRKVIAVVLGLAALFFTADYLLARKQASILKEKEARKERLEKLAFYLIIPDILDAYDVKGKDGEYEAVIKVENLADEPVYMTYPRAVAYVQTGTFWTEVPVRDVLQGELPQVMRLDPGVHLFKKTVTINRSIKYTYYQMFGYMHVRFRISMFVLPESAFKEEEVVDRYTDAYMYLKPYFITDREILRQVQFPDNKVPVMIPMPPH